MVKKKIKNELVNICKKAVEDRIKILIHSMNQAQESANAHKGAMESRYDTFKEEAQYLAGGYAKQLDEARQKLSLVKNISLGNAEETVSVGSVVAVEEEDQKNKFLMKKNYFVSFSVDNSPIIIEGKEYICLSAEAPIAATLMHKEIGDVLEFRNKSIKIIDLF